MKTVIKLQLAPSEKEIAILDSQSRMCNWLYNNLLSTANELRQNYIETQSQDIAKILYSKRGLRNLVPGIKTEHPFLKTVYSSPLKNTALRLTNSIQTYQKSRKGKHKSKNAGWPQFRSWKAGWFSLFYDEPNKGYKIVGNTLELSLGTGLDRKRHTITINMPEAQALKNLHSSNCRIVKQANIFYAVFTVEREIISQKPIEKMIALDPNHKNLAYGVDTQGKAIEIDSPWWLKKYDKRLDELKSKRDRCQRKSQLISVKDENGNPTGKHYWKASKRYEKYDSTLQKGLAKRREQTKIFCYTVANRLFREYDRVIIGDYTPQGGGITTAMRRAMNNRSLIGRFKSTLSWVGLKSGKSYDEFDEKGTTRSCHACGYSCPEGIAPGIRSWTCPICQTDHLRDENAAINGLQRELRNSPIKLDEKLFSSKVPSSGLVSVIERWAWRVLPSGVFKTPRGQNDGSTISAKKLNRRHGSLLPKNDHLTCDQV